MHFHILSVDYAANANSLTTKEGRREWENVFNTHYIQPVLENLDQMLMDTLDIIANDDKQGTTINVQCRLLTRLLNSKLQGIARCFFTFMRRLKWTVTV